jgi:hypothetical protein
MMKFQIGRAREYYRRAEAGIALLSSGAQLPVAVAAELYKGILDKIEANGYDNFNTRAYLTKEEKMLSVPPLWFKTVSGGWKVCTLALSLSPSLPPSLPPSLSLAVVQESVWRLQGLNPRILQTCPRLAHGMCE